jgi:predicted nucleotidyltransferase
VISLIPQHLNEIKKIFRERAPDCEVRVFGSRVNGTAQPFSDLDLALVGAVKLGWRRIERIKDAFSESDLPFIVDVLDWHELPENFRAVITAGYEVI